VETRNDSALMKQVQAGDTAQLAFLFERYHVQLFQYVLQLSRNRTVSEDIVQEVFFRILKYAASYDPGFPFNVWLYRMARNAYFDSLHKRRQESSGFNFDDLAGDEPAQEEVLARKQDSKLLAEALDNLPDDKREVLILSRFHDLRYSDIAQILKCEIGTVKVRVYRALKELREKFSELRGETMYDL